MWVASSDLPRSAGHPFYERLNRVLDEAGFDAFVEAQCARFYADGVDHRRSRRHPAPPLSYRGEEFSVTTGGDYWVTGDTQNLLQFVRSICRPSCNSLMRFSMSPRLQ